MWLNVTLILKFTLNQNVALFTGRQHQEAGLWQSYKIVEVSKEITARHTSNWGGAVLHMKGNCLSPHTERDYQRCPRHMLGPGSACLFGLQIFFTSERKRSLAFQMKIHQKTCVSNLCCVLHSTWRLWPTPRPSNCILQRENLSTSQAHWGS